MAKKKPTPAEAKAELDRRKKKFDWGDGRKVHSISREDARDQARARRSGMGPAQPLTAPLNSQQAWGQANALAASEYGPQIRANQQLYTNAPTWYDNYIARTQEAQKAQAAYAKPILDTAQAAVGNAAATAPGLDPSSPQYAIEQRAAAGRQTMAQDSANYLAGIPAATAGYLAGQQAIAARELPQVQAGLLRERAGLESDRQGKASGYYGDLRTAEINADLARQTLGLNTASAAADIDLQRGVDPVTGKPLPGDPVTGYAPGGPGLNKYGFTADEWSGMSEAAKAKARKGNAKPKSTSKDGLTPAQQQAAQDRKEKHSASVKATSNKVVSRATDAVGAWERLRKRPVKTGKVRVEKQGGKDVEVDETRRATPDDVRAMMAAENYTAGEIHIALLLRAHKPMDAAALQYIKAQGARLNHLPAGWVSKPDLSRGTGNPASAEGTGLG